MTDHVFITGIAGFLGSHLADAFLDKGWRVTGCDNLIGGYVDNVPRQADFYEGDLLDLDFTSRVMKDVDVVYHTACTAYEGLSVFSPSLVCANTYQISVNTMTAAIRNNVRRIVTCSSMARYGKQNTTPFREDMICKPQDPYGISKYAAELLMRNLADTHGVELVIAVPHNIIGPRQKYDDPFRNVASIMANLMLQGRQPIIYGDGEQRRCFSDVRDVVDCLMRLAEDETVAGELFNVGPDEQPVTINQLAFELSVILDFHLIPTYMPDRPQEVRHATCSSDKIRDRLGYQTHYTLRDALTSIVDYISWRGVAPFTYHLPLEIVTDQTPATWRDRLF